MILNKEEFKKRLVEMDPWKPTEADIEDNIVYLRPKEESAASHAWKCAVQEAAILYEEQKEKLEVSKVNEKLNEQVLAETVFRLRAALETFQNAPPAQISYENKLLDVSPEGMRFLMGEVWKYRGEVATLLPRLDAAAFGANQVREEVSRLTEELRIRTRWDEEKVERLTRAGLIRTKLEDQLVLAKKLAERYGHHDMDCAAVRPIPDELARLILAGKAPIPEEPCTCGFQATHDAFQRSLNPGTCGAEAASRAHVIDCPAKEEK